MQHECLKYDKIRRLKEKNVIWESFLHLVRHKKILRLQKECIHDPFLHLLKHKRFREYI